MIKGSFIENLGRVYAMYTGGFLVFIILMAILEQLGVSAATIGILLDEMRRDGRVKEGQLICFLALGSGLNWGATLLRM